MQTIAVFQQNGSAETKIKGIREFGGNRFDIKVFDVEPDLPPVLDDTSPYLPERIDADLVLDYLKHYDLSEDLSRLCEKQGFPWFHPAKTSVRPCILPSYLLCIAGKRFSGRLWQAVRYAPDHGGTG